MEHLEDLAAVVVTHQELACRREVLVVEHLVREITAVLLT
jgi:hypothetical protein